MSPLRLPDPAYASRTAWRLIVLVYSLVFAVVIGFLTADWWMSLTRNAPTLFIHTVSLIIPAAVSFALAAVGWASFGLRNRAPVDRGRAWAAFIAATLTFLLLTGGLLLLVGGISDALTIMPATGSLDCSVSGESRQGDNEI